MTPVTRASRCASNLHRVEQALVAAREALKIREAVYGVDHPLYATSLQAVAVALRMAGRDEEARPMMERALVICEEAYDGKHRRIAEFLANLSGMARGRGELEQALTLAERAHRMFGLTLAIAREELAALAD